MRAIDLPSCHTVRRFELARSFNRDPAFAHQATDAPVYDVDIDLLQFFGHSWTAIAARSECSGRMITTASKAGRQWYCCEHTRLCGNMLPAYAYCGKRLPIRGKDGLTRTCPHCAASYPVCPSSNDGWLVARQGRFGDFLTCVRDPECAGKERKAPAASKAQKERKPPQREKRHTC